MISGEPMPGCCVRHDREIQGVGSALHAERGAFYVLCEMICAVDLAPQDPVGSAERRSGFSEWEGQSCHVITHLITYFIILSIIYHNACVYERRVDNFFVRVERQAIDLSRATPPALPAVSAQHCRAPLHRPGRFNSA